MGFFDDARLRGVLSRINDENLFAEALREVENGIRRDGLWAMALADSGMNQDAAKAKYLKLRVRALRDELAAYRLALEAESKQEAGRTAQIEIARKSEEAGRLIDERNKPVTGVRGWLQMIGGLIATVWVLGMLFQLANTLWKYMK